MDPSRPLLGRGALITSSAHAAAALLLVAFIFLTLRGIPISLSYPPTTALTPTSHLEQDQEPSCDTTSTLDCNDPQLFHLMMRRAIDAFPDVHFNRFGRPVPGDPPSSTCDMAWRARSAASANYKDYRRFFVARDPVTCAYSVTSIGEYHSGPLARKPRRGATNATAPPPPPPALSRSQFAAGRFLAYVGGGDRCKPMPHYLRSLLCSLAEARYLNRTLVLDLSVCLAACYAGGMPAEGKRLGFYIDIEHLQSVVGIVEHEQFWEDWDRWGSQGQLGVRIIEDTRVPPTKFSKARDALIVRKFGDVEPGNYWYNVCEGEAERVLHPPQGAIRWAPSLMHIVDGIISKMQVDFDSVHVGGNSENLRRKIEANVNGGRQVYVAGKGIDAVLVDALKAKYSNVHYLDAFEELWVPDSKWFLEMKRLNGGVHVEFDGYMRELVDREVFVKGKKKVEVLD
uniref:O-fucosyltransferase family protein n=1 Tax=Leersia perrieri TaxID=77586 RepID=A0A0D9V6V7_9ORYZ